MSFFCDFWFIKLIFATEPIYIFLKKKTQDACKLKNWFVPKNEIKMFVFLQKTNFPIINQIEIKIELFCLICAVLSQLNVYDGIGIIA